MMETPELIALRQVLDTCLIHQDTLQDALSDLDKRNLSKMRMGAGDGSRSPDIRYRRRDQTAS